MSWCYLGVKASTYQGHTGTRECVEDGARKLTLQVLARNLEVRAGDFRAVVNVPSQALYLNKHEYTQWHGDNDRHHTAVTLGMIQFIVQALERRPTARTNAEHDCCMVR